jgi:glutaminyl-peptide cyclotransferase
MTSNKRSPFVSPPRPWAAVVLLAGLGLATCCSPTAGGTNSTDGGAPQVNGDPSDDTPDARQAKVWSYRIVHTYPHDVRAYTQGLLWHDGHLYESTGRPGESTVRKVALKTGKVVQRQDLDRELFGEGLTMWKGLLVQLTWQNGVAIYRDAKTLSELYRYEYTGEGWGLTLAKDELVMSDGSSRLQVRDPETFELKRHVDVKVWNPALERDMPLNRINELEWIDGELWANIYQDESIVRIDLETGRVTSWIDLSGLQVKQGVRDRNQDVLNGIAHDPETGRLFITGKYWPNLYEIELVEG